MRDRQITIRERRCAGRIGGRLPLAAESGHEARDGPPGMPHLQTDAASCVAHARAARRMYRAVGTKGGDLPVNMRHCNRRILRKPPVFLMCQARRNARVIFFPQALPRLPQADAPNAVPLITRDALLERSHPEARV